MTTWAPTTHGTQVTSWLPVTSYTPSAACYGYFRYQAGQGLMAFDPAYGYSVNASVTCEPAAITTWSLSLSPANSKTYVSLGPLTCPDAWSTVAQSEENASSTAKMCCPSKVAGELVGFCVSDATSGQTFTYASTQSGTYKTLTTTLNSSSSVGAYAVSGWEILQATEFITSTAPASVSATTTSTGSTATSTFSTSSTTSQSSGTGSSISQMSHSGGGLSNGAKIGIGVGVSLGVVGLIAVLVGCYLMGRRSRRKGEMNGSGASVAELPPASLQNSSSRFSNSTVVSPPGPQGGSELPVVFQSELESKANRVELP
ncbi:lpxtg-domain-containing protein [Penicillium herquei]|nr:lpxtg-domain-containing protein [Penicillium herquei]